MSLTEDRRDRPYPKLPFWGTVGLSYSTYFRNFMEALRASWLWLILVAALTSAVSWSQWSRMADMTTNMKAGFRPQLASPIELTILVGIDNVFLLLAGVSIAIAWHRLMILGEHPGLSGGNITSRTLWHYIATAIALALMTFLPIAAILFPGVLLTFAAIQAKSAFFLVVPIVLAAYAAGFFVAMRLTLLLPARAVGNTSLTFKQAWNRTRGNVWRLLGGILATAIPPILIIQIAFLLRFGFPRPSLQSGSEFAAQMTTVSTVIAVY